jgi:predicted nucleic acid-binding protein
MRAADTNVLVRLIVRDDAQQTAAAEEFARDGIWVSHIVLAELAWVLESVYDFLPAQIADLVAMLLDNPSLAFQDVDVVVAALAHIRARPRVGLSDCLLLEIARKAGHTPVGSFDRDFAKLPGVERIR